MRNLISQTFVLVLLIYPLSLSAQNSFSLSLDVNSATGDQAVTSLNTSANQVIAIEIFGNNIQNAISLGVRFEYDASQVTYEGFAAGNVLPNAQVLPEEGTGYVEIGIASLGGQATANRGLFGTASFRTTGAFTGTEIRVVSAKLGRGGQIETIMPNIRIALQGAPQPPPPKFSLSLDVDGSAGDQSLTSANVSTDEMVAIEIFGKDIRSANGLKVRFEYDARQVTYDSFAAGNVLPNAQALPEQGTGYVEIGITSSGGQATANSGLFGTASFRTTAGFSGTEIRLVSAKLSRGGQFETIMPNIRIALQGAPQPPPTRFSLSLDVDGSAGDQAVTSVNASTDETVAIEIFGKDILNANGLEVRFEYDASQVTYEGFAAGNVLPNAQALPSQGTGYVEIGIASLGGQATANSGLFGTASFRTTGAFTGTEIRVVSAKLGRGGQIETIMPNIRIALQGAPQPPPTRFSLSLDVDGATGDQAVTSLNPSANQVIAIEIFGKDIRNANGLSVRFEYDASQVTYEGFAAGNVLPNAQALPEQGTGYVEIGIASLGGQATANSGLFGTASFRTTGAFTGTEIRLVSANLGRGGQLETVMPNIRIALQGAPQPPPTRFSLSLDVDGSAGDQSLTSANVSTDETFAIEIFGKDIQNANGISVRFEYDARQVTYEAFSVDDDNVLPNVQALLSEGTGYVEIGITSSGGQATANSGLVGTILFRTTAGFSGTEIRLVRAELDRSGQMESMTLNVRVELKLQVTPDFNGDGLVNFADFLILTDLFGAYQGDGRYEAKYDLNSDGRIGWGDFLTFINSFYTNGSPPNGSIVSIPDANLRAVIETALDKASGAPITQAEMASLTSLVASNSEISDLTGLEHATGLTDLQLGGAFVGGWVNSNNISNLSPLSGLTNLTVLTLGRNSISDISSLSGLTNLTGLWLSVNSISDISVLSNLTNLTALWLSHNSISDLSPLVANPGLGSGDEVYVQNNPLSATSRNTHIPTLQARGVTVNF